METDISHKVAVTNLRPGDYIIGSNTNPYLLVDMVWGAGEEMLKLSCVTTDGLNVEAEVHCNAYVDAIVKRHIEGEFGIRRCMECVELRRPDEWLDNDYICIPCRRVLGLDV